jgi:hypothetical protein
MTPDITPASTQALNKLRAGNPALKRFLLNGEELTFKRLYFNDGLSRDPVVVYAGENQRVHIDTGAVGQIKSVNLADGERSNLSIDHVQEDGTIVLETR